MQESSDNPSEFRARPSRAVGKQSRSNGLPHDLSSAEFQSLLDNLEVGVAQSDLRGMIQYANARFAEILGHPLHSIVGSHLKRFVDARGWIPLCEALQRGAKDHAEGIMNAASDGYGPPSVIRLSFLPIHAGRKKAIQIFALEVTELVKTTRALERSEASLQSLSARLLQIQDEERRRLARDLHDTTGQELAVIIMSLDQLARQLTGVAGDRQKNLQNCAERLRKVETQIRTLSYVLHPPLLDEMGLGSALNWYLDGFSKRTGLRVKAEIPSCVPRFSIDKETALFRVIQESLTNAFRHSGSPDVVVRLLIGENSVEAVVQDHGKGFRSEKQHRSGVGLQSMKGRLEIVGGYLETQSDSHGTTITATVPVEYFELGEASPERREAGPLHSRRRILIADDHQVARRGIRILFEGQRDLEICGEASDGVEAVEKVKELKPDLVILDLTMPNMGGFAAANHIQKAGLGTKILVYTSHSYKQLEQTARAVGCDGYVVKSDASHDLIRATRAVLEGGKFYRSEKARAQSA